MEKIRVLVVDDAVVIRKILTDNLNLDPDITVVGTAPNGKLALAKIEQLSPDIVTLDVEMPELDGIATVKELKKRYPKLPVIMFSTLTARGAAETFEALAAGASDYVTKPANVGGVTAARAAVQEELVQKIKGLVRPLKAPMIPPKVLADVVPTEKTLRPVARAERVDVVVIGVSTGGPNALAELIPRLPANFPVPILLVQHMPPMFTKSLADRLNAKSALRVIEAEADQLIVPGNIYVAPGGHHLEMVRKGTELRTVLHDGPQENSCRPAVDVLFRSAVQVCGGNVLGVVLTGMGYDGLRGCQVIRRAGGHVLTQDRETSIVWGMPGAVTEAGLSDGVLPLGDLAQELTIRLQRLGHPLSKMN